jgi:hypothetical protein
MVSLTITARDVQASQASPADNKAEVAGVAKFDPPKSKVGEPSTYQPPARVHVARPYGNPRPPSDYLLYDGPWSMTMQASDPRPSSDHPSDDLYKKGFMIDNDRPWFQSDP